METILRCSSARKKTGDKWSVPFKCKSEVSFSTKWLLRMKSPMKLSKGPDKKMGSIELNLHLMAIARCLSLHCNCCTIIKKDDHSVESWGLDWSCLEVESSCNDDGYQCCSIMMWTLQACAFKWCLDWSKAERCLFIVSCVQWVIREGTRPYFSVHKCLEDHRLLAVSFFIISLAWW